MDSVRSAGILDGILGFSSIRNFFAGFLPESLDWLAFGLASLVLAFIAINTLVIATALYTWFERRAIGRFQRQTGPQSLGSFRPATTCRGRDQADDEGGYGPGDS